MPDASFFRLAGPPTTAFVDGAPLFAVEVRGEHWGLDAAAWLARRADYFAAGTRAVWDVDPQDDEATVWLYTAEAPDEPAVFGRADAAHAGPALPGFEVPVESLFPNG